MKNSKEKRKLSAKEKRYEEVLKSLFIYEKNLNGQKNSKNIFESITYEDDMVKFPWCYTQITTNLIFNKKSLFYVYLL